MLLEVQSVFLLADLSGQHIGVPKLYANMTDPYNIVYPLGKADYRGPVVLVLVASSCTLTTSSVFKEHCQMICSSLLLLILFFNLPSE